MATSKVKIFIPIANVFHGLKLIRHHKKNGQSLLYGLAVIVASIVITCVWGLIILMAFFRIRNEIIDTQVHYEDDVFCGAECISVFDGDNDKPAGRHFEITSQVLEVVDGQTEVSAKVTSNFDRPIHVVVKVTFYDQNGEFDLIELDQLDDVQPGETRAFTLTTDREPIWTGDWRVETNKFNEIEQ